MHVGSLVTGVAMLVHRRRGSRDVKSASLWECAFFCVLASWRPWAPRRLGSSLLSLLMALFWPVIASAQLPSTIDLNAGEEDVTIYGATADDYLTHGGAVAVGDLNGDGTGDLILAASQADGPSDSRDRAGEVYVYFGAGSLGGTKDIAGIVGTAPNVTIYGASARDELIVDGALAVGDLNGDGIDDLILGAEAADGPSEGRYGAGEAYIIFGSSSLPAIIDLNTSDEDVTIYGATEGDYLTEQGAVAVGDVNGDGTDDLILAARSADGPSEGRAHAGEAYVIFGSSSLPATIDLNTSGEDVTIYGATMEDHLTINGALVVRDLNGDGTGDLILGAAAADGPAEGRSLAGEAYVIFGSGSLPATIDLNTSGEDVTIYGATTQDALTVDGAVAVGDLNGDGTDDLILGARWADGPLEGRYRAGEAYIIFGSSSLPATIDLNTSGEDVTIYGATKYDDLTRWGALAVGDMNGDGTEDLILGAYNATGPSEGRGGAGEAYVIFGSTSLPATIDLNTSGEDVTIYGATEYDDLTRHGAVAVGDINGDGLDDLILGTFVADGPSDARYAAGEAYVILGSSSPPATIDLNTSGENVTIYGATAGDQLTKGGALAVGDVNGDGFDDLILGAQEADGPSDGRDAAGEAYVIFGSGTSTTTTVKQTDHAGNPLPEEYSTARTEIDFASGNNSSLTTVSLTRNDTGVSMGDLSQVADVNWEISTDRTNFSADVTFKYLDSEISGLTESALAVSSAATLGGVYTELASTLDEDKNEATVSGLAAFSFFIVVDTTDTDGDGLIDAVESNTGTFVNANDTGSDPNDADSDNDGLNDADEVNIHGTDPNDADSDSDGIIDSEELAVGTDPNSGGSVPDDAVWVDFAYHGAHSGSFLRAFKTISGAISTVSPNGLIRIKGDTAKSWTNETPRITKAMRIEAINGTVRIGTVSGKTASAFSDTEKKWNLLNFLHTLRNTFTGSERAPHPESEGEI